MPTFHVHIPAKKFSSEEKRTLADALNLALHEAMDTPMDDRFVIISEHKDDEFFIHPTFPDMKRSDKRMIITVTTGTSRTVEQKRKLADLVTRYAVEKVGVGQDDVILMMYAIPLESMSFGGGKLITDTDLSMPWVNKRE
jgi:phenylpyruvate tautomerase PptA (4-oxalocrotonate tautomerase family)